MPSYEIYAVKYAGPFLRSGALLMWKRDWEITEEIGYYIWCIKGVGHNVIVDTGVSPEMAKKKNLKGYTDPSEILSRIGIKSDEIRHVIITHMHWDHMSGVELFRNAIIYIQEKEFNFWMEDEVAQSPPFKDFSDEVSKNYLSTLAGTNRLVLLKGDRQVLPGIECLLAPGHSLANQAVAVTTAQGIAILGSDCAHVFQNYHENWPSALIVDLVGWMRTFKRLREKASSPNLLFPGHDLRMSTDYPEVAKDITRLV